MNYRGGLILTCGDRYFYWATIDAYKRKCEPNMAMTLADAKIAIIESSVVGPSDNCKVWLTVNDLHKGLPPDFVANTRREAFTKIREYARALVGQ